jgi:hypothetical protein
MLPLLFVNLFTRVPPVERVSVCVRCDEEKHMRSMSNERNETMRQAQEEDLHVDSIEVR